MKNKSKIFLILAMLISVPMILCISSHSNQDVKKASRIGFSYKDGLFYRKNSTELFTGSVVDTADVVITFEVVNGKKNGPFVTFYFNGKYEKYGLIQNNKNEGEWRYFYPDGRLESVGSYRSNKPCGKWTFYHPDGAIKADGLYINGVKCGAWMYYDTNGNGMNVLFFENGFAKKVLTPV